MDIIVTINGKTFPAEIHDTAAGRAFMDMLPLSFEMEELNGNEKCRYLSKKLPVAAEAVGNIEAGDIMLFGASCLVIFYRSFSTSYSYTRVGSVDNPQQLAEALGRGNVKVTFSAAE